MKRMLTLILALSMALSLAACGGGEDTPSTDEGGGDAGSGEPTKMTLILRSGTYADVIKECLPAFEEEHNVTCEVQELSESDLYSGIALDAINAKGTYDLCMVDGSWMAEFTENGVLANLSEMGYSFDDDIIEATTTICKVDENTIVFETGADRVRLEVTKWAVSTTGVQTSDMPEKKKKDEKSEDADEAKKD